MNSKTVTAIQGGKTKIAPFRSILMSRMTMERTQASPGYEAAQARSRPNPGAEKADQAPSTRKMNWRSRLSAPTAFMMPISRVRSRTLISIVLAMPRAETNKRHSGDAGHPAEDQKINQPLSLDEFDGCSALETQLFDASDNVLDVLLGIH